MRLCLTTINPHIDLLISEVQAQPSHLYLPKWSNSMHMPLPLDNGGKGIVGIFQTSTLKVAITVSQASDQLYGFSTIRSWHTASNPATKEMDAEWSVVRKPEILCYSWANRNGKVCNIISCKQPSMHGTFSATE